MIELGFISYATTSFNLEFLIELHENLVPSYKPSTLMSVGSYEYHLSSSTKDLKYYENVSKNCGVNILSPSDPEFSKVLDALDTERELFLPIVRKLITQNKLDIPKCFGKIEISSIELNKLSFDLSNSSSQINNNSLLNYAFSSIANFVLHNLNEFTDKKMNTIRKYLKVCLHCESISMSVRKRKSYNNSTFNDFCDDYCKDHYHSSDRVKSGYQKDYQSNYNYGYFTR